MPGKGPQDRLAGRNGKIWRAYIRGATHEALAAQHHISHQRISQILSAVRENIAPESIEDVNAAAIDLLRELTAVHMGIVDGGPQPRSTPTGVLVTDPRTGETVPDWSQVMQASTGVVRLLERAARILGSDAAAKTDATVTVKPEDIEVVRRIQEWKASRGE